MRPSVPVQLSMVAIGGAVLGLAEGLYHALGAGPSSLALGADGPDLLAFIGLGVLTLSLPALLGALARAWIPRIGSWILWLAALLPTLWAYTDHLGRYRFWPGLLYNEPELFHRRVLFIALALALVLSAIIAIVLARRSGPRRDRARRPHRLLWLLPAALMLVGALSLFARLGRADSTPPGGAPVDAPNVLMFTIDTLRQDAVGAYGGPSTPGLDALIESGIRLDGWSPAPWTRPAFGALFTGLGPTGNGGKRPEEALNPQCDWWPERLREAGWHTRAFLCNPHLDQRFGFRRGFAAWDHSMQLETLEPIHESVWARWMRRQLAERLDRGDRIMAAATRWLRSEPAGPWFVWVHVMDPHLPYHLRGPAGEPTDPSPGAWLDPLRPLLEDDAIVDVKTVREGEIFQRVEARRALATLYQREILLVDREVQGMFDAARAASRERGLLWVVASDHGEEFWDHDGFEHGHQLYREILRVPLAIGGSGLPAGVIGGGMKLQDIGPSLLGLLGLPPMDAARGGALEDAPLALRRGVLGEDLSEELRLAGRDARDCATPALVAEGMLYGAAKTRVLHGDGSGTLRVDPLARFERLDACADAQEWLGVVSADSVSNADRAIFEALDRWRDLIPQPGVPLEADPELLERLRAVGYVN